MKSLTSYLFASVLTLGFAISSEASKNYFEQARLIFESSEKLQLADLKKVANEPIVARCTSVSHSDTYDIYSLSYVYDEKDPIAGPISELRGSFHMNFGDPSFPLNEDYKGEVGGGVGQYEVAIRGYGPQKMLLVQYSKIENDEQTKPFGYCWQKLH